MAAFAESDWASAVDPTSGRPYYFNFKTKETQWEPPAGFGMAQGEELDLSDTNLAGIGSAEDLAARKEAAESDDMWQVKELSSEGMHIWRVENKRTEEDNPDFGINHWPMNQYGKFYTGDSYIILKTTLDEDGTGYVVWSTVVIVYYFHTRLAIPVIVLRFALRFTVSHLCIYYFCTLRQNDST